MLSSETIKTKWYIVNCAFMLLGAVNLALGVLFEINSKNLQSMLFQTEEIPEEIKALSRPTYLLIGIGAALTIIALLGYCGVVYQKKGMLLLLLFNLTIGYLVWIVMDLNILVSQPEVNKASRDIHRKKIQVLYDENEDFTRSWDKTMSQMECCGFNNYTDFTGLPFVKYRPVYPKECCLEKDEKCTKAEAQKTKVVGCFDALVKMVKENSLLEFLIICIAQLEVGGIIVIIILYKASKTDLKEELQSGLA